MRGPDFKSITYLSTLAPFNQKPKIMRQTLLLLTLAAVCVLPTSWTPVQAQNVEVRNFVGKVHPLRKIVRLNWWASEDSLLTQFSIEHSLDGVQFQGIGTVDPILIGEDGHIYEFWHVTPALGVNYYQLTLHFADSSSKSVDVITVDVGRPPIYSYPTLPGVDRPGATPLQSDPNNPWIEARVTDLYGRPVAVVKGQTDMDLPGDLPSGIYVLHARYASGWHAQTFVITQNE